MNWRTDTPEARGVYEVRDFRDPANVRWAQFRNYGWCFTASTPKLALQIRSRGRQDVTWRHRETERETA